MATTSNITASLSRFSHLRRQPPPPPPPKPVFAASTALLPGFRFSYIRRRLRASDPKSEADVVESSTSSVQESAFQDDSIYILKLAVGSIIGAGLIKYGSILFPSITSPNLVEALLMVSIPMVVAVLLLLQISRKE